jgi:hypothetical protein
MTMSAPIYWTFVASLVGAVAVLVVFAARQRERRLWIVSLLVGIVSATVWYATPSPFETRGEDTQEIAAVAICYVAMLFGMMAEYVYVQAEKGAQKLTFNALTFVMPILASPIVFIPLLTISAEVNSPGILSHAKLMVYLVAFQNGFFWKGFFEQRRREAAEGARTQPQVTGTNS